MYSGNIIELADVETIFENPLHPYTQGLLGSIPRPDRELDELTIIPGSVPSLINAPSGCRFHPRCGYARNMCSKLKPPEYIVKSGHMVACHQYGSDWEK